MSNTELLEMKKRKLFELKVWYKCETAGQTQPNRELVMWKRAEEIYENGVHTRDEKYEQLSDMKDEKRGLQELKDNQ